jgi:hypothetical protein
MSVRLAASGVSRGNLQRGVDQSRFHLRRNIGSLVGFGLDASRVGHALRRVVLHSRLNNADLLSL